MSYVDMVSRTIYLALREIFAKTNFCDINFNVDLFSQIAKSRCYAWIYFYNCKNSFLKTLFFLKKRKTIFAKKDQAQKIVESQVAVKIS